MEKVDFSVVITVLNEENTIVPLLDSLIHQSWKPKEIVIVDAGSNDATVLLIHDRLKNTLIEYQLFSKTRANRAQARNFGITKAHFEHIAVIDAGCEADGGWLDELSVGFCDGAHAVAGYYLPVINQPMQRLFAAYVATSPETFDASRFLPSSRSLAFTKAYWKQVGKYPEDLTTCEDLVFAAQLKAHGKMTVRSSALVYWQQADGLSAFFNQVRGYAQGDVEAHYMPHIVRIVSIFGRYVLFLLLPPLFVVYLAYPFFKHAHAIQGVRNGLVLPLVQLTADWGIMTGAAQGLGTYFRKTR